MQEAYKWFHPYSWKHIWVAFEISKLCSKFSRQLDGNSWDDQIAGGSIITFPFFNPFNHPPSLCQWLLVSPSSPAPYFSLTTSSVGSVTVTGKWATVSNLFKPLSPSSYPLLPRPPLATFLPSLAPSVLWQSLIYYCRPTHSFQAHSDRRKLGLYTLTFPVRVQHQQLRCCLLFTFLFLLPSPPVAANWSLA